MLFLPETKTGPRVVYLSAPALAVLAALPRVAKNSFVIVGNKVSFPPSQHRQTVEADLQGRSISKCSNT